MRDDYHRIDGSLKSAGLRRPEQYGRERVWFLGNYNPVKIYERLKKPVGAFTQSILKSKYGSPSEQADMETFFVDQLRPILRAVEGVIGEGVVIVTAPPSSPNKRSSIAGIGSRLAKEHAGTQFDPERHDGTGYLIRTKEVDEQKRIYNHDAKKDIGRHTDSIKYVDGRTQIFRRSVVDGRTQMLKESDVDGRCVLLLDDIVNTCTTLKACRRVLEAAGKPKRVVMLVLARTFV